MPTDEYECDRCGHHFERFQRMTEEPLKRCPKCRGRVSRLVGAGAGIIFKGSGFYVTDYRSSDYKESAKKDKESTGKEGGKTEAKPATSSSTGNKGKTAPSETK